MIPVAIRGMEFAVPKQAFTNDDMAKIVDTSDEWITQRTGIKTRYIASAEENSVTLAIEAVKKLFDSTKIDPATIDLIISATSAPERPYPSVACEIQYAFHLEQAGAVDIVAACSGFIYGLQLARASIGAGIYKRVLVIAADTTNKFVNWEDRSSCVLFGDGASATIVEVSPDGKDDIKTINLYADGRYKEIISLNVSSTLCPLHEKPKEEPSKVIFMNGKEVYKYVMKRIPAIIEDTLQSAGIAMENIDFFIPHQANLRMIEALAERMNLSSDKVLTNIAKYGNMSATSIPCVISEFMKNGTIKDNSTLLLSAFGAGMTAACAIVKVRK